MPIYEYECDECGHHMEALQKITDQPLTECDACHSSKLKKLISHSTFHLKGTGWYVTDYASKSGANHNVAKEKSSDAGGKATASASTTEKGDKKTPSSSSTQKKDT